MFCPACATAVEPGMVSCPNCGEPLPVAPQTIPVAPMLAPSTVQSKPAPVRTAVVLLWATLAVGVFTIAISLIRIASRLPSLPRFLGPILVMTVLWVLGIVFTARRSNVGRFLVFVLVAYAAFNLVYRFRSLVISANPGALISLIELAVRLYAIYLLLRPESNAWFADKEQGIIG